MNPESGKKKHIKSYEEFYDILRDYGYDTKIVFTKAKGDATRIVESLPNDISLVISGGGDGTLNEIVTGDVRREHTLTIAPLPLGSTNDVGNMYGLDQSVYGNLRKILSGKAKKVDVCFINNTPFVYVACLGDYIDMAYNTPRSLKKKYGKIAYILYGAKQLRNKIHKYHIKYKIDNKEYEGVYSFIFISNSSRIAGQPDVYYDVKLDDKKFEVALANVKDKKDMFRMLVQTQTLDIKDIPGITYYRTDNLEIEFIDPPKTSWCLDGEEYKSASINFKFDLDQCIKMQVPNDNIKKIFKE